MTTDSKILFNEKEYRPEFALPPLKSICRWLTQLPEPQRFKALNNTTLAGNMLVEVNDLKSALQDGFSWADTPEKEDYWQKVFDQINN